MKSRSVLGELLEVLAEFLESFTGANAKRTLCCNVLMHDVWMHANTCPQARKADAEYRAWRAANPGTSVSKRRCRPTPGDKSGLCPNCGYPTGHYGIYTVGEPCSWCGYIERRIT